MIKFIYFLVFIGLCVVVVSNLRQINQLSHSKTMVIRQKSDQQLISTNTSSTVRLRAVGDIMLGRHVGVLSHQKNDWTWAFQESLPKLPASDFLVGNLEFPVVKNCPYQSDGMVFCAPPESVSGLTYARFNLVSLANNHSGNYGAEGLDGTINSLLDAHITPLTDYQSVTLPINNIPFGFLALHDLYRPIDASKTASLIQELKKKSVVIVVLVHWGNEYETSPTIGQKKLAKMMIDSGATLILGTHPHVLQPIESTNSSLIAYSLGNFIFDQMWSEPTRKSVVLDIDFTFKNASLSGIKYVSHPTTIYDFGQPRLD